MSDAARTLQALRRHKRGGRPPKQTYCRCGKLCPSAREAAAHCRKKRT